MTCPEIATFAKDIILAVAAIIGASVAIKGLSTWKRQLSGQSQYELSRRILVALFRYRDAINGVRNTMFLSYEIPQPPNEEVDKMSPDQISFYGTSKAYESRWGKVQEQRTVLYADLLEAEAIWGTEFKELFKVIFNLEHELRMAITRHLRIKDPATDEDAKNAELKIKNKNRNVLDRNASEDGPYSKEFLAGIDKIETYLKPKLTY